MLQTLSRRDWLSRSSCGFGSLALTGLAARNQTAMAVGVGASNPLAAKLPHRTPKAKRVIFLFMQGGVSQVDSFDHKPRLVSEDGKMLSFDDARVIAKTGMRGSSQRIMKPLWKFAQQGQCGRFASDLFPEMNRFVDDMCFIHSMHTEGVAHGPATLFLHCGATNSIRPSMGSWILYGLGAPNENLPGFITIGPSSGNGGPRNYGNAFLPAIYQGTALGKAGGSPSDMTIKNLHGRLSEKAQADRFGLLRELHSQRLTETPGDLELEAIANSYELAWRMRSGAAEVLDLSLESRPTLARYGIGEKATDSFGKQCLMARRLCEQGVRFIQVTYGDNSANPAWDQHSDLPKHGHHARAVDRPIAGLLADLKERGLLEDTIVWWGGEFGRTPYAEKNGTGRDHNPGGFTVWLAGGGFKPGFAHGATDDFGAAAVEGKVHMHDLHATILHQLGMDHERLSFRFAGRDFRLTDVHGRVVREVVG